MPSTSSTSSKRTYLDYPHLRHVQDFADYARSLGALLILLYGSVARGEFREDSDADVFVLTAAPIAWRQVYQRTHGIVQPVVKTVDEMLTQMHSGEPFFLEMIEDGVPLHDSDGWHRRLLAEVEQAKTKWGLTRTTFGWQWAKWEQSPEETHR